MKKYAMIVLVAAVLLLSACDTAGPGPTQSPGETDMPPATSAPPSPDTIPGESDVDKLLAGEPSAAELGTFLRTNAGFMTAAEADLVLERLLLVQMDISKDMNSKIWKGPYMQALNDTMGGVLDAGKIPDIEDAEVRRDFQNVSDALLTMVRYEETPVFEPDWTVLATLKTAFGHEASDMIEYSSRLQNRYYFGDPYDFDTAAADIVAVEKLYPGIKTGFVRWRLRDVYQTMVGRLLFGPEGSHLYALETGDEAFVTHYEKFAQIYGDTAFGVLCGELVDMRGLDAQTMSDYISEGLRFPPRDPKRLTRDAYQKSGASIAVLRLSGLGNGEVEDRLNEAVRTFAENLVSGASGERTVSCYVVFSNDNFINFSFTYSLPDKNGMARYSEVSLTLDLKTGEPLTLDDLVGKPFDAYRDDLLAAIGDAAAGKITAPPNFYINREELIVTMPSDKSDWPDYFPITYNGLRAFMDVSQLY